MILYFYVHVLSQQAQEKQQRTAQELEDTVRIVGLLTDKVRVLTEHAVTLETQSKQYNAIAPVLDKLMNRFGFATPQHAIETMDHLQSRELDLFTQLTTAKLEVSTLEAKVCIFIIYLFIIYIYFNVSICLDGRDEESA